MREFYYTLNHMKFNAVTQWILRLGCSNKP